MILSAEELQKIMAEAFKVAVQEIYKDIANLRVEMDRRFKELEKERSKQT